MLLSSLWGKSLVQIFAVFWSDFTKYAPKILPPVFFSFFLKFMVIKPPIKFFLCVIFDYFSRTYDVEKFWIIKLHPDVSDIIQAIEQSKYANCGLPVNFWIFLLTSFCIFMKMIILSKSCYSGLRSPLKEKSRSL